MNHEKTPTPPEEVERYDVAVSFGLAGFIGWIVGLFAFLILAAVLVNAVGWWIVFAAIAVIIVGVIGAHATPR